MINTISDLSKEIDNFKKKGNFLKSFFLKQYSKFIPSSKVIAVSGNIDLDPVISAIKKVLSTKYEVSSQEDNSLGKTDYRELFTNTILRTSPKAKKVILGFSFKNSDDAAYYLNYVKPQTLVLTRLSFNNPQYLVDDDISILETKKTLDNLPAESLLILNGDDAVVRKVTESVGNEKLYFGTDQKICSVWAGNIRLKSYRIVFELNYGVERVEINSQFFGFNQIYTLLAAASVGISLEMDLIKIKKVLEKITPLEHRLQLVEGANDALIIDDTFNNQPFLIEEGLEYLNSISARRRIVVLGELKNLGDLSEKVQREIARKIYKEKIDAVLIGSGNTKFFADELYKLGFLEEKLFTNLTNTQIISQLLSILARGDVVLINGATNLGFDEIVKRITKPKRI